MEKIFAERIKNLRQEKELSQNDMAVILKTYQQNIAQWEVGKVLPNTKTLYQLAKFFDVSMDYLVGLSDDICNSGKTAKRAGD